MKGDFTHFTHRPEKRYTRVLEQQGRVRLDADFNEWVEIVHHLERTEAIDVIGRCGVPKHGGGFEIDCDAGTLTISRGRIYVDGILCSNEAENETEPVPLDDQPDLPEYDPPLEDDGTYLVYLDVWERHVTAVEDPELREVALGGPDTTTRTRTVCQVKVDRLEDADAPLGDLECVPFEAPSSTGRLAARAEPTEEASDPCALPAKAGYRGLENRLYRVEIHDPSEPTFKWSRDNGSVVLPITKVEALTGGRSRVTVETLGRDEVLTVREGDWVEVLGDETELRGEPGTLAQIASDGIDRADREITLDADVTAHDGEGHLKLRRWDHDATDDVALQGGALPIQTTWFELEDGVEIRFDGGASYQAGDYWVIPARTRVGDVLWPEIEGTTPPEPKPLSRLGIEHHYCTLALARRDDGDWVEVSDCRPEFPPLTELEEGCCTVVVAPGEDIQKAIDSLPPEGGCVCLKAGEHEIDAPVEIDRSDVHLHGESSGARVVRRDGDAPLLEISRASDVLVESIEWESTYLRGDALVSVHDAARVTLRHCRFEGSFSGRYASFGNMVGLDVVSGTDVCLEGCVVSGVTSGVEAFSGARLTVQNCQMVAKRVYVRGEGSFLYGDVGVMTFCMGRNRIRDNRFDGFPTAVQVAAPAAGCLIEANRIDRKSVVPVASNKDIHYAVAILAPGAVVRDNVIAITGPNQGGIHLAAPATSAEENRIENTASPEVATPTGILVEEWLTFFTEAEESTNDSGWMYMNLNPVHNIGYLRDDAEQPTVLYDALMPAEALSSEGVVVAGNRLYGPQNAVVVQGTRGTHIRDNYMDSLSGTADGAGVTLRDSVEARVTGNRIEGFASGVYLETGQRNEVEGNQILGGDTGVAAEGELDLQVSGNEIHGAAVGGCLGLNLQRTATFADNRLTRCGWRGLDTGAGVGIGVAFGIGEVDVHGCKILDTGIAPDGFVPLAKQAFGIIVGPAIYLRVESNTVGYTHLAEQDPTREDRALFAAGWFGFISGPTPLFLRTHVAIGSALILGNEFLGPGRSALIETLRFENPVVDKSQTVNALLFDRLTFSDNHCDHLVRFPQDLPFFRAAGQVVTTATVRLHSGEMIVTSNHVKSTEDGVHPVEFPSFDVNAHPRVAITGNVSTGVYLNVFGSKPPTSELANFNIIGV